MGSCKAPERADYTYINKQHNNGVTVIVIERTSWMRFCSSSPRRAAFTLKTASLMENGSISSSSLPDERDMQYWLSIELYQEKESTVLYRVKETFFDLLDVQHVVQSVVHERRSHFHQAQGFYINFCDALTLLQDLDADGERVQWAAKLVENVLKEVSAGLVDATEVFLCNSPARAFLCESTASAF